eukprot:6334441-Prymnesium_polylepis.1
MHVCDRRLFEATLWRHNASRACILDDLRTRLDWWRHSSCTGGPPASRTPDVGATLCRIGAQGRSSKLTHMLLVRSLGDGSRLRAAILIDQGDKRLLDGPDGRLSGSTWPARALATLEQLAELQQQIDTGALPPLPPFTAIIN